jgi:hypothetical protein
MDNEIVDNKSITDVAGAGKKIKPGSRIDRFVRNYVETGHQLSQSVIKAGFKAKDPSNTGCALMKRPHVIKAIQEYTEVYKASFLKDKPTFLSELAELRERAKQSGRIGDEVKVRQLEAEIMGLKATENQQQINVFGNIDSMLRQLQDRESKEGLDIIDIPPTTGTT